MKIEIEYNGSLAACRVNGKPFNECNVDEQVFAMNAFRTIIKDWERQPFKAENFYVSKVDGKIHDITYNPSDKVEQKINIKLLISVLRKHLYTCIDKITSTEIIDKIKADLNIE